MIKRLLAYLFGGSNKKDTHTGRLVKYWLLPNDNFNSTTVKFNYSILLALYKRADLKAVQAHVRSMDYPEFLHTPYWISLSKYLKLDAACKLCGSGRRPLTFSTMKDTEILLQKVIAFLEK